MVLGVACGGENIELPMISADSSESEVAWPLAQAIASIPNLVVPQGDSRLTTGPFARFEDPKETAALRSVRERANDDAVCVSATGRGATLRALRAR